MTELVATSDFADLKRLVARGEITLPELMDRLAPKLKPTEGDQAAPGVIVLADADKKALRTLPVKLASLELPTSPRELSKTERDDFVPVFDQVKLAKSAVEKAESALKEAFHNDIDARTEGDVGSNGHKLTEGEVLAEGYAKKVTRGLVGGKGVDLTDADLQFLLEQEKITKAQYNRMTKSVTTRQIVADAVMAEITRDSSLLEAIASVATRAPKTTAIRMAKN